jgi:Family of unknown function (DUF6481)
MSAFREPGFKERQEAAAKAKQAALDKLRARQNPVEPAVVQKQADRVSGAKERSAAKGKGARATEKAEKQAAGKAAPKAAPKAARKTRGK